MYSGDPCPYCGAAKALLKSKNIEIEEFGACFGTADFKEGTSAFLAKRRPSF